MTLLSVTYVNIPRLLLCYRLRDRSTATLDDQEVTKVHNAHERIWSPDSVLVRISMQYLMCQNLCLLSSNYSLVLLWFTRWNRAYCCFDIISITVFSCKHISVQGRIQGGPGGPCPPVVSVCNIFCAWLLAFRHTTQLTSKRLVNRIAEGVGITPPLPNP